MRAVAQEAILERAEAAAAGVEEAAAGVVDLRSCFVRQNKIWRYCGEALIAAS